MVGQRSKRPASHETTKPPFCPTTVQREGKLSVKNREPQPPAEGPTPSNDEPRVTPAGQPLLQGPAKAGGAVAVALQPLEDAGGVRAALGREPGQGMTRACCNWRVSVPGEAVQTGKRGGWRQLQSKVVGDSFWRGGSRAERNSRHFRFPHPDRNRLSLHVCARGRKTNFLFFFLFENCFQIIIFSKKCDRTGTEDVKWRGHY